MGSTVAGNEASAAATNKARSNYTPLPSMIFSGIQSDLLVFLALRAI